MKGGKDNKGTKKQKSKKSPKKEENAKDGHEKKYFCLNCNKGYEKEFSLERHMRNSCIGISWRNELLELIEGYKKRLEELEAKYEQIIGNAGVARDQTQNSDTNGNNQINTLVVNSTINNNTTNVTNITNVYSPAGVKVVPYNSPEMFISVSYGDWFNACTTGMWLGVFLFNLIYADPNHPENHSLYVPDKSKDECLILDRSIKEWIVRPLPAIVKEIDVILRRSALSILQYPWNPMGNANKDLVPEFMKQFVMKMNDNQDGNHEEEIAQLIKDTDHVRKAVVSEKSGYPIS
jgi:hypothetical protein